MGSDKRSDMLSEADVAELQSMLALAEQISQPRQNNEYCGKFVVLRKEHTKLVIRPDKKHKLPHFHIEYKRKYSATYATRNLQKLNGKMPRQYEHPILKWAKGKEIPLTNTYEV